MDKSGNEMTIIGANAKLTGELHHDGAAQVLGVFEGKIVVTGQVHIGDTASCRGTIEADQVLIDGEVEGDVLAHQRLQLTSSARVVGDLVARTLIVEEGASFVGHCKVSSGELVEKASVTTSKVSLDDLRKNGTSEPKPERRTVNVTD
jgi:cytoskeletal protein CcmA (bactofilin family)